LNVLLGTFGFVDKTWDFSELTAFLKLQEELSLCDFWFSSGLREAAYMQP
jgi:hypothetical protein